jgi:hypothetical protein
MTVHRPALSLIGGFGFAACSGATGQMLDEEDHVSQTE